MTSISEKVILITGASSGIGAALARELGRAGARLMIGARRTDRLAVLKQEVEAAGGTIAMRALDVTRRQDMEDFVRAALDAYGRVDVIVNNAGVMPLSLMNALKVEEWVVDARSRGRVDETATDRTVSRA